jgi:hypothetical protein
MNVYTCAISLQRRSRWLCSWLSSYCSRNAGLVVMGVVLAPSFVPSHSMPTAAITGPNTTTTNRAARAGIAPRKPGLP